MRDIKRIKPILNKIEKYWNKVPDWRLGQLLYNVINEAGYNDIFFIEDENLENYLDDFFSRILEEKT